MATEGGSRLSPNVGALDRDYIDREVALLLQKDRGIRSILNEHIILRRAHEDRVVETISLQVLNGQLQREASALRAKKAELGAEKARTQITIRDLEAENAQLKIDFEKLALERNQLVNAMVSVVSSSLTTYSHTAQEELRRTAVHAEEPSPQLQDRIHGIALRFIFDLTVPPPGLLSHSLVEGPRSPWCRALATLKSITLVSKTWHSVAFPLFYRDIVLRRVGQVVAFARTIRSSPETFGPLVHTLVVSCEVPDSYLRVTRESFAYILAECPNLKDISF